MNKQKLSNRYYEHVFWAAEEVDFDDSVDDSSLESLVDACHYFAYGVMKDEFGDHFDSSKIDLTELQENKLKTQLIYLYDLHD